MRRLLLLAFIWGWSFLFIKVAVRDMTPTTVAATRMVLGSLVLLGFIRARRWGLPSLRTWGRHFLVVAVVGSAIPFTLLAWGEQYVSSALTAVLNASTPLFAAVMARVMVGDRLNAAQVGGLLVGFAGVVVTAGLGVSDLTGSSLAGEAASVAAALCYGTSFAYTRKHLMTLPPVLAAAGQVTVGAALLVPVAVATSVTGGFRLTPGGALSVLLLGAFGTGVAYVLSYRLIADIGPTRASLVTYLIPAVAVTVGVVFLDEPFSLRLVVGGLLIVAGIAMLGAGRSVIYGRRLWRGPTTGV